MKLSFKEKALLNCHQVKLKLYW